MKPIKIKISDITEASSVINSLNDKIPKSTKSSPEFTILYPQVTACIEDFSRKAKKLPKTGTTIHIQKEFTFPDANVLITLEYPRKVGIFEKLFKFLIRKQEMSRYRGSHYRSHDRRSIGHERALEHIREAEALTRELGGTDQDVKKYLFSLSASQLKGILDEYEQQYGNSAREYAEKTLPSWKSGKVLMSGMVAERIFNLLPPTMPLEIKFQLTENLWKHVSPSSAKNYYIGLDANLDNVTKTLKEHLEEVIVHYEIPSSMESRFNWLAQGDVRVKQKLLNHFRQQEKLLLSEALRSQLPVLLNHLNSETGKLTTHAAQVLKFGKHEIRVTIDKRVNGISETDPALPKKRGCFSWIWWVIGIFLVLWFLSK